MSSLIGEEISASGGWISFERFMEMALYTPGLGYYAANREIFGTAGDFITAPGIGTLFATCLAGQVAEALRALRPGAGDVIEIGAGAGDLAASMLMALGKLDALPDRYFILETSAALQSRQLERLASLPGELRDRVRWVENIPGEITGVVLANEVLDAMPVQRFRMDRAARVVPLGVTRRGDAFAWQTARRAHCACPGRAPSGSLRRGRPRSWGCPRPGRG